MLTSPKTCHVHTKTWTVPRPVNKMTGTSEKVWVVLHPTNDHPAFFGVYSSREKADAAIAASIKDGTGWEPYSRWEIHEVAIDEAGEFWKYAD
jgi:hypothetical protein